MTGVVIAIAVLVLAAIYQAYRFMGGVLIGLSIPPAALLWLVMSIRL